MLLGLGFEVFDITHIWMSDSTLSKNQDTETPKRTPTPMGTPHMLKNYEILCNKTKKINVDYYHFEKKSLIWLIFKINKLNNYLECIVYSCLKYLWYT